MDYKPSSQTPGKLSRAKYEFELAKAHRALWAARQAAADMGQEGCVDDLYGLEQEVISLAEDSLRTSRKPRGNLYNSQLRLRKL